MNVESRLTKLESLLPAAEYAHLSEDDLNTRLINHINAIYGSWEGMMDAAAAVKTLPDDVNSDYCLKQGKAEEAAYIVLLLWRAARHRGGQTSTDWQRFRFLKGQVSE